MRVQLDGIVGIRRRGSIANSKPHLPSATVTLRLPRERLMGACLWSSLDSVRGPSQDYVLISTVGA